MDEKVKLFNSLKIIKFQMWKRNEIVPINEEITARESPEFPSLPAHQSELLEVPPSDC